MADQFSRMYDVERVGGDQRTRLAEMLRANALNQPQGQMVSGWYVPPAATQNLNQLAQTALGTYMGASLDEERKAKTAELLRQLSQGKEVEPIPATQNFNGMERMAEGQTPMPQQAPQNALERITQRPQAGEQSQAAPAMMPQQQQRYVPLTEEEKIGKVMELAQYNPYAAQIWSAQDTARQNRMMKLEDTASQRQWQAEQNQMNREGRMDMARLTAGLAAANRPERMVTLMDAEGNPYTTYQSQMQPGAVVYNPQTAKQFKEKQTLEAGKKTFSQDIQGLRNQYDILNKNMAIPSEQNKIGSNVGAWLSGTAPGQFVGRLAGTESATARDTIRMSRPALMQSIVKASGMSAKQIDSNAEMKLMLDMATDPSAGYEANINALNSLQSRFAPDSQVSTGLPSQNDIDAELRRRQGR